MWTMVVNENFAAKIVRKIVKKGVNKKNIICNTSLYQSCEQKKWIKVCAKVVNKRCEEKISHHPDKQKIAATRLILKIQRSNFSCKSYFYSWKKSSLATFLWVIFRNFIFLVPPSKAVWEKNQNLIFFKIFLFDIYEKLSSFKSIYKCLL